MIGVPVSAHSGSPVAGSERALIGHKRFVRIDRVPRMGIDEPDLDAERVLAALEVRVGEVVFVEDFQRAQDDVYKLEVDFGEEVLQSVAEFTDNYDHDDLFGSQVLAVVDLEPVTVAGFESQCRIAGVDDGEGGLVHLQPERDVPNGMRLF